MKTVTAILFFILITIIPAFTQGEIDDQEKIFYRNERTYAILLNTNGWGGNFRYAKRINGFKKTLYEIDLSKIKHEKELKITFSSSQQFGTSFVYGKLNTLFTLRGGIGIQKELFTKEDKGGISIRYFYTLGPSIGLQKPVYYEIFVASPDSLSGIPYETKIVKFESHLLDQIQRRAPFYVGLKELSIVPGLYCKFGFTFEFGKNDASFNAIETGVIVDAFIRKIPILANNQNHWYFPGFFVSYRFGRIIDAQLKKPPSKLDNILAE
jgi:hypothetical protein